MRTNNNVNRFENDVFDHEKNWIIIDADIENFVDDKLINRIRSLSIENIEQLEEIYLQNEKSLKERIQSIFPRRVSSIVQGVSVLILINYVLFDDC